MKLEYFAIFTFSIWNLHIHDLLYPMFEGDLNCGEREKIIIIISNPDNLKHRNINEIYNVKRVNLTWAEMSFEVGTH